MDVNERLKTQLAMLSVFCCRSRHSSSQQTLRKQHRLAACSTAAECRAGGSWGRLLSPAQRYPTALCCQPAAGRTAWLLAGEDVRLVGALARGR